MVEGANEYFQYQKGLSKKDLTAEREALNELKLSWDDHLRKYKSEEDQLKAQFESTKTNFESFFKQSQEDLKTHLQKHSDDLNELKKTYDQFMALKAPVDYWQSKRKYHQTQKTKVKNWSIGAGISGGIIFTGAISYILSSDTQPSYCRIS